jgi:hypothetical protein
MFNRTYHLRTTKRSTKLKAAGGGHRVAEKAARDLSLRLPWGGIFEPWRPFVLTAQAAEMAAQAPAGKTARPKKAAARCRKGTGWLQGVQLDLFPEMAANSPENQAQKPRESADDSDFPPLAAVPLLLDVTDAIDSENDRPLADLFPDAYE